MPAGTLYIVAAPSGAGKTSLLKKLVETTPKVTVAVSHTTRPARPGETDGVHYHFIAPATFAEMIAADAFLEYAQVFDYHYGTSRAAVQAALGADQDVILEIDWQGARQVRAQWPESIGIFILPPSRETLRQRLISRGQDRAEVIARRMAAALDELTHCTEFDYWVINDHFPTALAALRAIVLATRCRQTTQRARHAQLIAKLLS